MKILALVTLPLLFGVTLAFSQGTISLSAGAGTVYTNGTSIGLGVGPTQNAPSSFYYEVLDMTESQWSALTGVQQTEAANLFLNPSAVNLWTDSGVSGINGTLFFKGEIASAESATAANWAAPSGSTYDTASSYDYYTIIGWSANEGTTWSTVDNELLDGTLIDPGWFGQTAVAYNYAGGNGSVGSLIAVDVWASSDATGLASSGFSSDTDVLTLLPVPEPTTLALAAFLGTLGGLLMLFLRRKS